NWELVDTPLLAKVIGAEPAQVEAVAASLGLGANRAPSRAVQRQIYITIVRRNWHLLPREQLLTLIGMNPAEFEFRLKEDDALALKLGSAKPACESLTYQGIGDDVRARAAQLQRDVAMHFGA